MVRGLRAVSDFEFEFQLALMNRKLNERIETIFMMPKDTYTFLSSRIVKEIARLGGDVSSFVPARANRAAQQIECGAGLRRRMSCRLSICAIGHRTTFALSGEIPAPKGAGH